MSRVDELIRLLKESTPAITTTPGTKRSGGGRAGSDEYYVIGLCNEALGLEAEQQYKFPFLLGDSGRALPVDAYYRELNLVIEYYERQHTEDVNDAAVLEAYGFPKDATESDTVARLFKMYQELTNNRNTAI